MDTKDLDASQLQELEALVSDFQDTFSTGRQDVGRTNVTHHQNDTGDAPSPPPPPSNRLLTDIPIHRPQQVEHLINEIQEQGITQPSQSPWPSLSCRCKKKSPIHFCMDYRKYNKVTRKDSYPLPRVDSLLNSLAGPQWFATLDPASGY